MEKILDFYKEKNIEQLIGKFRALTQGLSLVFISFFVARALLFDFMNPLMVAFLSGFLGTKRKIYVVATVMAIGSVTRLEGLLMLKSLSAIVLVLLAHMILGFAQVVPSLKAIRIVAGFSALVSGLLFAFLFNGGVYFILLALGKCVFAVALAGSMKEGNESLKALSKVSTIGSSQALGLMILFGAVLIGTVDIYIGFFAVKYVVCALVIMSAARHRGASYGALCGVSLGVIFAFSGSLNYSLIGVFSVGGIVAGLFQGGGKKAVVPGFLLGAFIGAMYLDSQIMSPYFIISTIAASVLFLLIPDGFPQKHSLAKTSSAANKTTQLTHVERRLSRISISFKNMSQTLAAQPEKRQRLTQHELSRIIEDTAAKACEKCPNNESCWGENYLLMHHASLKILENCENNEDAYIEDYNGSCEYFGYFSGWISRQYDLYKLNLSWQNQMAEAKRIMSQQLMGMAEIADEILFDIRQKEAVKSEFYENIIYEFAKKDIEVKDVIVLENAQGKYSVSLERSSCFANVRCFKDAAKIISKSIGRKMVPTKKTCNKSTSPHAKCSLHFMEEPRFRIRSAAAYLKKSGSDHSGDCHSVMEIRGSQAILALSDGMGSGKAARDESEAAMGLLKDFLEAGFSRELALRLINSTLVLKDGSENFSTMDICAIDIHTGLAQFIKFGAASTFIKRGNTVSQIASESLPMGILTEIDAEICKRNIKGDDIIVMITDGVYDSGRREEDILEKNWVANALLEFGSSDPQEIADYLIKLAQTRSKDEIKDDMTILCARVYGKSA